MKTVRTSESVKEFIKAIESERLRRDAETLHKLFRRVTKKRAYLWGPSIIGYGQYSYQRKSGKQFEFLATGFSPRKSGPVLYIMPGYDQSKTLLEKLGPHKLGKSCLYLKSLENIDQSVLEKLIELGLEKLKKDYKISFLYSLKKSYLQYNEQESEDAAMKKIKSDGEIEDAINFTQDEFNG